MYFGFTADQVSLRDGLRDLLTAVCPPAMVRAAWEDGHAWRKVWSQLADLGLLGLLAPAEAGGMGCTELDLVLLLEECGRFAVPGPLAEHVGVAVPALAAAASGESGEDDTAMDLDAAVHGRKIATAAEPGAGHVRWARQCDLLVYPVDGELRRAHHSDVDLREDRASVDRSVPAASVVAHGTVLPGADPLLAADRGTLANAAQLLGLAAAMIDVTAGYVRERTQFGVPIGAQQAVKHQLADALIALEHARPVAYRAGYALTHREPDGSRDVSFAKVYAYRAADRAARVALQCHGAIGYTWEHDLHLWMKRVWALRGFWGTPEQHEDRVAMALLD